MTRIKFKKCTKCGRKKSIDRFHFDKTRRDGYYSRCKTCCNNYKRSYWLKYKKVLRERCRQYYLKHREKIKQQAKIWRTKHPKKLRAYTLKRHYRITNKQYHQLLKRQNNHCAICKKLPRKRKHLGVDHDHKTGKIRGLLCENCNKALGMLYEDIKILKQTIKYLQYWKKK